MKTRPEVRKDGNEILRGKHLIWHLCLLKAFNFQQLEAISDASNKCIE